MSLEFVNVILIYLRKVDHQIIIESTPLFLSPILFSPLLLSSLLSFPLLSPISSWLFSHLSPHLPFPSLASSNLVSTLSFCLLSYPLIPFCLLKSCPPPLNLSLYFTFFLLLSPPTSSTFISPQHCFPPLVCSPPISSVPLN